MASPDLCFDTQSPEIHGVDERTGQFHTYIPIASLVGNEGRGPVLDLKLFYSPTYFYNVFGNWSLRFSNMILDEDETDISYSLATGEYWNLKGAKTAPPGFKEKHVDGSPAIVHKNQTTQELKEFAYRSLDPEEPVEIVCFIPHKITESGLSLTIDWEISWETSMESGPPRLKSIRDERTTLLNVSYSESGDLVTFEVYPGTPKAYSYQFEIELDGYTGDGHTLTSASLLESSAKTEYTYDERKLESISSTPASKEQITYDDGRVSAHTVSSGDIEISKTDYSYTFSENERTTTRKSMIDGKPRTTTFYYDADGVQTKEIHQQGDSTHTIALTNELVSKQLVRTTQHTYQKNEDSRTETSTSTVDAFVNLVSSTANGVTTEWTYYRGAPKEEDTVTGTRTVHSGSILGAVLDHATIPGLLNRLFNKQGLSWGTVEDHTITYSRYRTDTGKKTYNLPVDIICPGDPNYFRVHVESEKVYTYRDNKRVDLKWTFYGYSDLPSKDSAFDPTIKPSLKLTILDPVTDDFIKLKSWQDGAMTLETIEYYTDSKDTVSYARVKSTTQTILDSKGQEIPLSKQTTTLQYKLEDDLLTTTSTLKIADLPAVVTSETVSALTLQVHESVDSLGNKTSYRYDNLGRLTSRVDFDQSDERRSETRFTYETQDDLQCVETHFPGDERYREERDALGRIVNTKSYHEPSAEWLTLSTTTYDELGREKLTTEYDYYPDGEELLSRELETSYDDWGQASKVQVVGGQATCSEYDPISRQLSQWRQWGDSSSGTLVSITDDPKGGQQRHVEAFVNDATPQSTSSRFDAWGRLSEQTPSVGPAQHYKYDHFGRLTQETCAGVETHYEYPNHTPTATIVSARIAAPGTDTQPYTFGTQQVDGLGRVKEATVGGRKQTYTYTGGSLLGESSVVPSNLYPPTKTPSFESSYDKKTGRINEKTVGYPDTNAKQSYAAYSLRGLLLEIQDAFGNVTKYEYDSLGRLTGSTSEKVNTSLSYDDNGSLSEETVTDNIADRCMTISYSYDEQLRESERRFSVEGFTDLSIKRTYENHWLASCELLQGDKQLRMEKFTYTDEGRLASYRCSGSQTPVDPQGYEVTEQDFSYDKLGKLTRIEQNGNTLDYTYDSTDRTQLKSVTQSAEDSSEITFYYDELGRLKGNNHQTTFKYDSASRLSYVYTVKPYSAYEYLYDPLGRQVCCYGTDYYEEFYYQDQRQYARKGIIKIGDKYFSRSLVLLNNSRSCLLQEQKRKPASAKVEPDVSNSFEICDAHGTLVASYDLTDDSPTFFAYTPFGYRPDHWDTPHWLGFNGQPIDRTSGTYPLGNGYRVYDPRTQHFQAPDSLSPFDGGGLDAYSYCSNNPINFSDPSGHAQVVHQYSVMTHAPLISGQAGRILDAAVVGGIGIALAPFTGGASVGWTVAAVGLATVSAGFGIASAALAESDPELSKALGWASLGTGVASFGVGALGAKVAARGAVFAANAERAALSGGRLTKMGGNMRSLTAVDGELFTYVDTYKNANRLNISVHGKDLGLIERALNKNSSVILNNVEHSASDLLNLLKNKGIDPNVYDHVRLLICYSGNGGATSFAAQFRQLVRPGVKAYVGPVTVNYGSTSMAKTFAEAPQLLGPQWEQQLASSFARNAMHKVVKNNPYSLLTDPVEYMNFRYSPVHFP